MTPMYATDVNLKKRQLIICYVLLFKILSAHFMISLKQQELLHLEIDVILFQD